MFSNLNDILTFISLIALVVFSLYILLQTVFMSKHKYKHIKFFELLKDYKNNEQE